MSTLDARAWLVWLFAGGLLAILVSNPFYLVLLLLISRLVDYACAPVDPRKWRLPFWRISLVILFFSTLFNMLTAHFGQTVLFSIPPQWPLIGGPVTLEAAVFGLMSGLRLITLLSFFMAFNMIVPVSQLAGLTPRALHELGLVMLIAITYIPETVRQFQRIRDAQAIRGHQLRGLRTWRPIVIPLLIAGLERALNLSETMVSRGYGSTAHITMPFRARLLMLAGLMLTLGGALRLAWSGADGWFWLGLAGVAIAWAYHDLSHLSPRTRYRANAWSAYDSLLIGGALISLISLAPLGDGPNTLFYSPYPLVEPPLFNLWIAMGLFGLVVPALQVSLSEAAVEAYR